MIAHGAFVEYARREGEALAAAAESGDLEGDVPACPGWTLRDLVDHVGVVHRDKTNQLRSRSLERVRIDIADPAPEELLGWYRQGLTELIAELAEIDPMAPVWTWDGSNTASFWSRRMAHENAVHRFDAQSVSGKAQAIDADLALDGIDEYLFVHMPPPEGLDEGEDYRGPLGSVAISTADGNRSWSLALQAPAPQARVEEGRHEADLWIGGQPSDLLLFLWRRIGPEGVEWRGDPGVMDGLQSWLAFVGE